MGFAPKTRELEVVATLRFNEFEGGFWSLELDPADPQLGGSLVMDGATPPAGMEDGALVRARVRTREEQFGFLMAGTYVDVVGELRPA
ncbi:MAG: hypothetical protein JWM86_834 [Thermoleophilia bacterium]|nr:hypothetical protein [Thermoleophilia bacterium]